MGITCKSNKKQADTASVWVSGIVGKSVGAAASFCLAESRSTQAVVYQRLSQALCSFCTFKLSKSVREQPVVSWCVLFWSQVTRILRNWLITPPRKHPPWFMLSLFLSPVAIYFSLLAAWFCADLWLPRSLLIPARFKTHVMSFTVPPSLPSVSLCDSLGWFFQWSELWPKQNVFFQ